MNKILTLIIPTYNMEKYLDKCLTSLIIDGSEQMKLLEVLVIIDGATDRSSEIAHGYVSRYPDIFRVIDKENGNYGSCVNRGLLEAEGKYIKILDADDWFDTAVFEIFIANLKNSNADLVVTDRTFIYQKQGTQLRQKIEMEDGEVISLDETTELPKFILWQMHNLTVKTSVLRDMNYVQTEGMSYTDTEYSVLPLFNSHSIQYFDLNLYCYLLEREDQTMSASSMARSLSNLLFVLKRIVLEYVNVGKGVLSNVQCFYIENQIYHIYRCIMSNVFSYSGDMAVYKDQICEIDNQLNKFPHLYRQTNEICLGEKMKFYYIDYFRKYGKDVRKTMKWHLYMWLLKMKVRFSYFS